MSPRAVFGVVFATFLWGTAFPLIKIGFRDYGIPPLTFAGIRFTLAGLLLLGISAASARMWASDKADGGSTLGVQSAGWGRVMTIGLLSTTVFYGLFFSGLKLTSATSASVLDGANPIIGSIMAHFVLHNDRLTRQKLLAIITAFIGVAVIALSRGGAKGEISTAGCMMILLGFTAHSVGTMLVITYRGRLSLHQLTGYEMLAGGLLLVLVGGLVGDSRTWLRAVDARLIAMVIWLAMVSAVAFRIWYGMLRRYKVTSISVYSFLVAVWGALLSIIVLREQVSRGLAVGAAFVAAGVYLMNRDRTSQEREFPDEV
jgi:drug/metabolite transporter (DMT)-like permease